MTMPDQWNHKIFKVSKGEFEDLAIDIFRFQYENNPVYRSYIQAIKKDPEGINVIEKIPFMPVSFFKSSKIVSGEFNAGAVFESSGTTGTVNSRHYVKDLLLYEESFLKSFEMVYGSVNQYCILGLLPSYLEKGNSSLVYMVNSLVNKSGHPQSGFYLDEYEKLSAAIVELEKSKQKTLLIGVTFALLDFAERYPMPLQHTTIIETGGMKGRKKEMIREELHTVLRNAFNVASIHSEYGMTELLSQAYSVGDGIFKTPPWMKLLVRDEEDPFLIKQTGSGIINVIDLANINSCAFIATDDAGKIHANGSFEVLGRVDGSDLRGCSLLVV